MAEGEATISWNVKRNCVPVVYYVNGCNLKLVISPILSRIQIKGNPLLSRICRPCGLEGKGSQGKGRRDQSSFIYDSEIAQ